MTESNQDISFSLNILQKTPNTDILLRFMEKTGLILMKTFLQRAKKTGDIELLGKILGVLAHLPIRNTNAVTQSNLGVEVELLQSYSGQSINASAIGVEPSPLCANNLVISGDDGSKMEDSPSRTSSDSSISDITVRTAATALHAAWVALPTSLVISRLATVERKELRHTIARAKAAYMTRSCLQEVEQETRTRIDLNKASDGGYICVITGTGDLLAVAAYIDGIIDKACSIEQAKAVEREKELTRSADRQASAALRDAEESKRRLSSSASSTPTSSTTPSRSFGATAIAQSPSR